LLVRARNSSGTADATPASWSWTVDTVAPASPVVSTPADGATVSSNTPRVTGTAEAGVVVTVMIDGTLAASTVADAMGNWSVQLTAPLADGMHSVSATATDAAQNTGPASTPNNFGISTIFDGGVDGG